MGHMLNECWPCLAVLGGFWVLPWFGVPAWVSVLPWFSVPAWVAFPACLPGSSFHDCPSFAGGAAGGLPPVS